MQTGLKNGMHKPIASVTLEGDAAEILAFCQRLASLCLEHAAIRAVVRQPTGPGYVDYTFMGIRNGSTEESMRNLVQLERQGRITRQDGDELAALLEAFARLQR